MNDPFPRIFNTINFKVKKEHNLELEVVIVVAPAALEEIPLWTIPDDIGHVGSQSWKQDWAQYWHGVIINEPGHKIESKVRIQVFFADNMAEL